MITVGTSFGLFILGYFINMDYDHITSDKGASICEKSAIFRYSGVDFTYEKYIPFGNMISKRYSFCKL